MTDAQISVAKRLYAEAAADTWQRSLRAKVDASRKAERCRVTYCEVDVDE